MRHDRRGLSAAGLALALIAAQFSLFAPASVAAEPHSPPCESTHVALVDGEHRCLTFLQTFKDCPMCPELVLLPAGTFEMGSPGNELGRGSDEGPLHRVEIKYAFAIAKYETTFDEWDACVADGACTHRPRDAWGRGRRPVINVSWDDITLQYLPWLTRKTGKTYRLLSEAEWEYAARAGTSSPFSNGQALTTAHANFDGTATYGASEPGEYRKKTLEVGSFPANPFGLHDMHGNVWEWVADCYAGNYDAAPADGSAANSGDGCQRVMRGGSWIDSPRVLRSAARGHVPSSTRFIYRGFRVGRTM